MKISKVTWIILGIVLLAVGFGIIYTLYSRQIQEQDTLKATVANNQVTLAGIVKEQEKWRSELAAIQEQLVRKNAEVEAARKALIEAKSVWPRNTQSIEYDEKIFALAKGWALEMQVITATDENIINEQGISFINHTFTFTVTGKPLDVGFSDVPDYEKFLYGRVADILGFLSDINKDTFFSTARIDLVSLQVPFVPDQETLVSAGIDVEQPVASITVTVYSYKGS